MKVSYVAHKMKNDTEEQTHSTSKTIREGEQLEVEMNTVIELSIDTEGSNSLSFSNQTIKRLKAMKKYSTIWKSGDDEETQQKLRSLLINLGTNILLQDDNHRQRFGHNLPTALVVAGNREVRLGMASIIAMVYVSCHHDYDVKEALTYLKSRIALRDLNDGLHYDIIKFFHKRSTCQCLKKIYLQERVKSRRAVCKSCKVRKERSQLYLCAGCLYFYYCSEECQAAEWPVHQEKCYTLRGRRLIS